MRKKELISKNLELFEQTEALRAQIAERDKKIGELERRLNAAKKEKTEEPAHTVPLKRLEEKLTGNTVYGKDIEYASEVIGKLVLESATGCNRLTSGGDGHRELVNLLLGKTEVAKAEILSAVCENVSFEAKKEKIDSVASQALDYFASVLAQLN